MKLINGCLPLSLNVSVSCLKKSLWLKGVLGFLLTKINKRNTFSPFSICRLQKEEALNVRLTKATETGEKEKVRFCLD